MESAAAKRARLDRSIARTGETVTLQRTSVDTNTGSVSVDMELTLPAHVRASAPQDLLASTTMVMECRVVLSGTQLQAASIGSPAIAFGIPLPDDRIIIQGGAQNIQNIAPLYYDGELVRVNLLTRG